MWRCHWNKHWTGRDSRISGLWIKKTAMLLKRLDTQTMSENKLSVGQKWYQKWLQFCGLSLFIMHLRPRCIGSCFAQLTCWTWACNCVWTLRHFPYVCLACPGYCYLWSCGSWWWFGENSFVFASSQLTHENSSDFKLNDGYYNHNGENNDIQYTKMNQGEKF